MKLILANWSKQCAKWPRFLAAIVTLPRYTIAGILLWRSTIRGSFNQRVYRVRISTLAGVGDVGHAMLCGVRGEAAGYRIGTVTGPDRLTEWPFGLLPAVAQNRPRPAPMLSVYDLGSIDASSSTNNRL